MIPTGQSGHTTIVLKQNSDAKVQGCSDHPAVVPRFHQAPRVSHDLD